MGLIPSGWYKHPIVRTIMRGVRVGVALMIAGILAALAKEPALIAIAPILVALDKHIRDRSSSE